MQPRELFVFVALSVLTAIIVMSAVTAYHHWPSKVPVAGSAVRVETNKATGETKVDAPSAHVEKSDQDTRVDAPGVKVKTPKPPPD
jgi:hypothetical protein